VPFVLRRLRRCIFFRLGNTRRIMRRIPQKDSGPLWTRTTDPSLIRTPFTAKKLYNKTDPHTHIDDWYNELRLRGTTKLTIKNYIGRIRSLLNEYPKPNIPDIKDYLIKKQQAGLSSGTIANYVKAYRSFFDYLSTQGLYDTDCRCLRLAKVKYSSRC
jgi:hypothetical protein